MIFLHAKMEPQRQLVVEHRRGGESDAGQGMLFHRSVDHHLTADKAVRLAVEHRLQPLKGAGHLEQAHFGKALFDHADVIKPIDHRQGAPLESGQPIDLACLLAHGQNIGQGQIVVTEAHEGLARLGLLHGGQNIQLPLAKGGHAVRPALPGFELHLDAGPLGRQPQQIHHIALELAVHDKKEGRPVGFGPDPNQRMRLEPGPFGIVQGHPFALGLEIALGGIRHPAFFQGQQRIRGDGIESGLDHGQQLLGSLEHAGMHAFVKQRRGHPHHFALHAHGGEQVVHHRILPQKGIDTPHLGRLDQPFFRRQFHRLDVGMPFSQIGRLIGALDGPDPASCQGLDGLYGLGRHR